jgi:hypothetical protein
MVQKMINNIQIITETICKMDSLFVTPQNSKTCIDLIDSSGSTLIPMDNMVVFDHEKQICQSLSHEEHRLVFWNSDRNVGSQFDKSGVFKWPNPVKKNGLDIVFASVKPLISGGCYTMPHLGFTVIDDWLKVGYSTVVNFVTDGEMGWHPITKNDKSSLVNNLINAIKHINKQYPDVQINIFAVERESMTDYSIAESMNGVVGNDVYSAFSDSGQTSLISKFITFSKKHPTGHVHINKVKTPAGFVPYGSRYFSILSTSLFITYIAEQVGLNKDNDSELLKIIQDLSVTLSVLTKDKPKQIREKTINIFCNMFANTSIDLSVAKVLLTRAIEAENAGSAQLHSDYRANLKSLYSDADRALRNNAASAMMIGDRSISLPMSDSGHIFLSYKQINRSVLGYFNGGIEVGGKIVPVLPLTYKSNLLVGQCIRQWIRLLISTIYHINSTSDEVIFIMMMINMQAKIMKLDKTICDAYTTLVGVLLEKKRANIQKTELENLMAGNLFVPNDGNINNFKTYVDNCIKRFGMIAVPPQVVSTLRIWYYMCQAYSQELADSQFIHCKSELSDNPTYMEYLANIARPWTVFNMQEELEFYCLVTVESTEKSGGFKIKSHNVANSICAPKTVFSKTGMDGILSKKETSMCLICYTSINQDMFEHVDPYKEQELDVSTMPNKFGDAPMPNTSPDISSSSSSSSSSNSDNILVFLKGTVGCGKSTYAKKLQKLAQDKGYDCVIEGTDQYAIRGIAMKTIIGTIKRNLNGIMRKPGSKKMVIIDTCGERANQHDVFGVDFTSWLVKNIFVNYDEKQQTKYLAWSLRNVVQRGQNDAVLTVGKASLPICLDVHHKKAASLFQGVTKSYSNIGLDDLIVQLNPMANEYAQYLEANKAQYEPSL